MSNTKGFLPEGTRCPRTFEVESPALSFSDLLSTRRILFHPSRLKVTEHEVQASLSIYVGEDIKRELETANRHVLIAFPHIFFQICTITAYKQRIKSATEIFNG